MSCRICLSWIILSCLVLTVQSELCGRFTCLPEPDGTCVNGSCKCPGDQSTDARMDCVDLSSLVNVALNKSAEMSSSRKLQYRAYEAVDGSFDQSFIHTEVGRPFAWWKVDLGHEVQDAIVRIYFRTIDSSNRNGVKLYTSTTPFSTYPQGQLCHTVTGTPWGTDIPDVYSVSCHDRFRYLLLYTNTSNTFYGPILDFREVEVWAVDDGTNNSRGQEEYLIYPNMGGTFSGWKVDLEHEVQEAVVRIYFRTDSTTTRNGVKLYTSTTPFSSYPQGQLCHTVTGNPDGTDIPDVYNVTCPGRWGFLLLYTDTENSGEGASLDFRKVEVLACPSGSYGENCAKNCSSRYCVDMTTCGRDGRCSDGCLTGWTGEDCIYPYM